MNIEIDKAIIRVINEWCSDCRHASVEDKHCDFKDYKEHCAIAELIFQYKKDNS